MAKKHLSIGLSIVALGAVGTALWLNAPVAREGGVDVFRLNRQISDEFESQEMARTSDKEAVRTALAELHSGVPQGLERGALPPDVAAVPPPPEVHRRLLSHVAKFLHHLSSAEPGAYSSWQRSRGYRLSGNKQLLEKCAKAWKFVIGEDMPEGLAHEQIFDRLFGTSLAFQDGQMRPVAVSRSHEAGRIRYLRLGERALSVSSSALFIHTAYEIERWAGYVVLGTHRHWDPPVSLREVVQRDGYADCALVSIGVLGSTGEWMPTNIFAYYDPDRDDWHFDLIGFVNAPTLASTWHY